MAWHPSEAAGKLAIFRATNVTEVLDMADELADFVERLRILRKQKNLSQTELGQQAGLHSTHIGRFERGLSRPGGDTLKPSFAKETML